MPTVARGTRRGSRTGAPAYPSLGRKEPPELPDVPEPPEPPELPEPPEPPEPRKPLNVAKPPDVSPPPELPGLPEKVEDVLDVVDRIPEGRVLTYGDVAELVGSRGARFVGNVMSRYGSGVPWWRVVRAGGWPPRGLEEQALPHFREEGTPLVRGTLEGLRVDLVRARWEGPAE